MGQNESTTAHITGGNFHVINGSGGSNSNIHEQTKEVKESSSSKYFEHSIKIDLYAKYNSNTLPSSQYSSSSKDQKPFQLESSKMEINFEYTITHQHHNLITMSNFQQDVVIESIDLNMIENKLPIPFTVEIPNILKRIDFIKMITEWGETFKEEVVNSENNSSNKFKEKMLKSTINNYIAENTRDGKLKVQLPATLNFNIVQECFYHHTLHPLTDPLFGYNNNNNNNGYNLTKNNTINTSFLKYIHEFFTSGKYHLLDFINSVKVIKLKGGESKPIVLVPFTSKIYKLLNEEWGGFELLNKVIVNVSDSTSSNNSKSSPTSSSLPNVKNNPWLQINRSNTKNFKIVHVPLSLFHSSDSSAIEDEEPNLLTNDDKTIAIQFELKEYITLVTRIVKYYGLEKVTPIPGLLLKEMFGITIITEPIYESILHQYFLNNLLLDSSIQKLKEKLFPVGCIVLTLKGCQFAK
jgi:hypothetical protein